jgi:hypothetical protein
MQLIPQSSHLCGQVGRGEALLYHSVDQTWAACADNKKDSLDLEGRDRSAKVR